MCASLMLPIIKDATVLIVNLKKVNINHKPTASSGPLLPIQTKLIVGPCVRQKWLPLKGKYNFHSQSPLAKTINKT